MAKRFTAGFKDDLGLEYNLDFYDDDYVGATVGTLTLGTPGFEMDWDGRSQNTHEPILASACSIPVFVSTSTQRVFIEDVQTGQEGRFRVEVFRGPAASQQLFWSGVLFCDITLEDDNPQLVTLQATDDLGLLDEVLYKDSPTAEYTDTTNLITVFCRILGKVRHIDAWAADKNFLYVSDHVQHDDMASAPYTRKIIINHTKLRNANDNGEAEYFTCKQVLIAMLTNLQARLMQYHGAWWIIPVAKSNADLTAYAYFKNGDNGNNSTANTPSFVTQSAGNLYALSTAITSANKTKLAGFQFGALPGLSEVNYKHNYNGSAADFNGLDYTGVSNIQNPTVNQMLPTNGDVVLEDDDVVTLTFSYVVQIAGYGTDASSDRGRRAKFSFRYNHGDICARRNVGAMLDGNSDVVTNTYTTSGGNMECFVVNETAPIYDTTSTNEVQVFTGVFDRFVGGYLTGTVSITFPAIDVDLGTVALPTIGFLNVKIFDKTGADVTSSDPGLPGNFDSFCYISDIYQMRGSAILDGDQITYTRTNTAASARESLDLPAAILADKVGTSNPNQGVWLINDDGNFVKSTPNWSSSTFPSVSTPICDLTCVDIISLRQTPLSTATGTVRFPNNLFGPCFAVQGLDSDTAYYVPMRLRLIANDALYEGEWFKYQYDSSTATTASDDSVPIPTAAAEFVRGFRRQRQTLNTLQQTMSEATMRLGNELEATSKDLALLSNDVSALQQGDTDAWKIGEITSTDLVAHWDASNSNSYGYTGTTVTDVVGAVTLTLQNGAFWQRVAGIDSFKFDGTNDDLGRSDTPSDLQFQFSDPFSIGIWLNPAFASTAGFMCFCGNPDQGGNFDGISFINGATNDRLTPRLWLRASSSSFLLCSMNGQLTQNSWQYLVVTYAGSKAVSSVKFYLNGSEVTGTTGTDTGGASTINHSGNKYTIGSRDSINSFYGGEIADVHVYDDELRASDVLDNYNNTKAKFML